MIRLPFSVALAVALFCSSGVAILEAEYNADSIAIYSEESILTRSGTDDAFFKRCTNPNLTTPGLTVPDFCNKALAYEIVKLLAVPLLGKLTVGINFIYHTKLIDMVM